MAICTDLMTFRIVEPRTPHGCEECLATGTRWVHLRLCMTCGHVGCCDASPGRHATAHATHTQHPVIQSYEVDEDWAYCYAHDAVLPHVPPEVRRPRVRPVRPGAAGIAASRVRYR